MNQIGLPTRAIRPLVDRLPRLATMPGYVPDLVPADADIAQHPLVEVAKRLHRAPCAKPSRNSRNCAAKQPPRLACITFRRFPRGPERPVALECQNPELGLSFGR